MKPHEYSALTSILVPMAMIAIWILCSMFWPAKKGKVVKMKTNARNR